MQKQNKSGGVLQGFARLPIQARTLSHSICLLFLLISSCEKIDLSPKDATVPDNPSSSLTDTIPTEVLEVDAIPAPCTLWQGHIVALVEPLTISAPDSRKDATVPEESSSARAATVPEASSSGSSEALVTLLSLYEWSNLPSALHATNPTEASTLANGYQEYDLTHWRIPTTTQAKAIKASYPATVPEESSSVQVATVPDVSPLDSQATVPEESSSGITSINALLMQAEGLPLTPDARYLCEGGQKSFSFALGTTISTVGTKITTYRLRLVKTLRLRVKR